ncbi:MAG: hypothetical protein KGY45_02355 [Hadesarchaea archaeon]|nr:hypothetical protein [Hadesarchaea archaeon]
MRKYYVIYDHKMNSKHIPRNFYYQLKSILDNSEAERIQYSAIVCYKNKIAVKIANLCIDYGARVKIITGTEIN